MFSLYKLNSYRDSNVELMRLVCMVMILVHHLISHVIYNADTILGTTGSVDCYIGFGIFINALCYVGVNCFMLITGYYSAKFKWKALLKLYIILCFYATIQTIIKINLGQIDLSLGAIKDCILVFSQFSHSNWWFMNCYVIFFLLTPLINVRDYTKKQYRHALFLLILINIYLGYWWQDYTSGYTVAQFVFMYVIGGYIRRFINIETLSKFKSLLIYMISIMIFSIISISSHYIEIPHWRAMPYNNPLIVIASIGFFCFFLKIKMCNKLINFLAESAISIYLLQNFDVFRICLKSFDFNETNHLRIILSTIVLIISFCLVAVIIDQFRRAISFYVIQVYNKFLNIDNLYDK